MLVGQTMDSSSRGWNLLVLEILHLLLRWETPQSIWGHYMKAHTTAMRADLVGEDERDGDEAEDEEAEEERRHAAVRKMSQLTTASRLQEQFRVPHPRANVLGPLDWRLTLLHYYGNSWRNSRRASCKRLPPHGTPALVGRTAASPR